MSILKIVGEVSKMNISNGWRICVTTSSPKELETALLKEIPRQGGSEKIATMLEKIQSEHGIQTWERNADNQFIHSTNESSQWIDQGYVSIEKVTAETLVLQSCASKQASDPTYAMGLLAGRFCEMLLTHFGKVVKGITIIPG